MHKFAVGQQFKDAAEPSREVGKERKENMQLKYIRAIAKNKINKNISQHFGIIKQYGTKKSQKYLLILSTLRHLTTLSKYKSKVYKGIVEEC
jgi:hypothetical protein